MRRNDDRNRGAAGGGRWSRRGVLRQVGGLVAATAFAPGFSHSLSAQQGEAPAPKSGGSLSKEMEAFSVFMGSAASRELPPPVLQKAKFHVLDTFAAMISGLELDPGRAAIRFATAYGGQGVATIVASKLKAGPIEAALANGVMAHADETDDSHAPATWHPGCAVVPAAFAVGEQFSISGMRLLRAVSLGYDVGSRVMTMLRTAGPQRFKSSHSIAGVFGAAAAAGSAASLTPRQMRWLLDYTSQQSSGIAAWSRDSEHIEKGFAFGGMPARSGVTSALLVQFGWTGIDDIFTGENNFIIANAPEANPERLPLHILVDGIADRRELMHTNIKKWSVGSPIQAPLDAIEILQRRRAFAADDVKEVVVRISGGEVVNNREMPDISLQHMVAVMPMDKDASFLAAHDRTRMSNPVVLRHRAKVRLVGNDPRVSGRQAIVEITLNDGTMLSEHVRAVRGTAENPMTQEEEVAKCRALIAPVLGAPNATRLIDRLLTLDTVPDVRSLQPLLQKD